MLCDVNVYSQFNLVLIYLSLIFSKKNWTSWLSWTNL